MTETAPAHDEIPSIEVPPSSETSASNSENSIQCSGCNGTSNGQRCLIQPFRRSPNEHCNRLLPSVELLEPDNDAPSPSVHNSPAPSSADYQKLYIESLIDRIVSLENQVDKQNVIIMGLINKPIQQPQPPQQLPPTIPAAATTAIDGTPSSTAAQPAIPGAAAQKHPPARLLGESRSPRGKQRKRSLKR